MYEVFCWVKDTDDISNFLGGTERFSKRFYTVTYSYDDHNDKHWIYVNAIAISRVLVSILRWSIPCDYDELSDPERLGKDNKKLELPPHGYIPANVEFANKWFPRRNQGNYMNVFKYNGFHRKNQIKTDWNTKPLSDRW